MPSQALVENDSETQDNHIDLQRVRAQHHAAGRAALAAGDRADELRANAADITAISAPLTGFLDAVRRFHTIETWEGISATRSRDRLDEHEQRCATALITIDGILADLDAEVRRQSSLASQARSEQRRLRPRIYELQNGLGPGYQ